MLMQAQTPQTCLLPPGLQQLQAPLARLRRLCPARPCLRLAGPCLTSWALQEPSSVPSPLPSPHTCCRLRG